MIKKSRKGVLEARASLCSASMPLQFPWLVGEAEPPKHGPDMRGIDKYTFIYDTSDHEQVMLVGRNHEELVAVDPDFNHATKSFADVFKSKTADFWCEKLNLAVLRSISENRELYASAA